MENGNAVFDSRNACNAIIETASNKLVIGCQMTVIPNTITCIGEHSFIRCNGLTSISIPSSVTNIGDAAFRECSSLVKVIIPETVSSIGWRAFYYCSKMKELNCEATTPPTCTDSGVFEGIKKDSCTLYVPKESLSAYQIADQWKDFYLINDVAGIVKNTVDFKYNSAPIYNLQGVQMKEDKGQLPCGIYIQEGKKMMIR